MNKNCEHDYGNWKKQKDPILECESMEEDSPVFLGNLYIRRCKNCGQEDTKIERIEKKVEKNKKGKGKKLGLKRN